MHFYRKRGFKMKIVVLAGGTSTERDVSLVTGTMIYKALKNNGHQVVLLDVYLGYDGEANSLGLNIFDVNKDWAANISAIKENNPDLGFITLYNEDGTGAGKASADSLAALRTYNYVNQNSLEVLRNHANADIDEIQAGDTAYLKLDEDGSIVSISAVENYTVKYGKILSKLSGGIAVEFEDGDQQILDIGGNVLIIQDKKLMDYKALRDGDRVRLLLNITNKGTDVKEITIEGNEHLIANIYKGTVTDIDTTSDKMNVLNLRKFRNGSWEPTERKGYTTIPLADEYAIYAGGRKLSAADANKLLYSNDAYIAVIKDYGGEEKAYILSYRNGNDTEVLYSDNIAGAVSGSGSFDLARENKEVAYDDGSIIVKNGRLITGNRCPIMTWLIWLSTGATPAVA
jgi:hypothetical protein